MNVAFICAELPDEAKGGSSYAAHHLANELVGAGHDVTMFSTSPRPEDGLYEVSQIKPPAWVGNVYWLRAMIFSVLVAFKDFSSFDLIHSHGEDQYIITKTPIIRTYHGSALDEAINATTILRFLHQFFYVYPSEIISGLKAKARITVSDGVKKRYPFKTDTIYCGLDLGIYKPGEKNKTPVILYVGASIKGRKRGDVLLEYFIKNIKPSVPDAELWLVCKEKIQGDGIKCFNKNLTREALSELYQKAWVFCMPSKYEGLGKPYLEAMASGCVVVTTKNGGSEEILKNGKYGCIVKIKDVANAIIHLLEHKDERLTFEMAGIERAKEFSTQQMLIQYQTVYERIYRERA